MTQLIFALLLCLTSRLTPTELWADGANGDIFDPFFRYNPRAGTPSFAARPIEEVDPFTGNLRILHTDIVLPGKGGFNLALTRHYNSKVWGRRDHFAADEAFIGHKEFSWLGPGWSLHMGRIRNPGATGFQNTCLSDAPVFEGPDGTTEVFYWNPNNTFGQWVSKNHWRYNPQCTASSVCVYTDTGVTYEFYGRDFYYYGGETSPSNLILPAGRITDTHGNSIFITYMLPGTGYGFGGMSTITDSYGRVIFFNYGKANPNSEDTRLLSINVNGRLYQFRYWTYDVGFFPGSLVNFGRRDFLSEVLPPSGPSWRYTYYDKSVYPAGQALALASMTHPGGATISYQYDGVPFFTGYEYVQFYPVTRRTEGGRNVPAGTWIYTYDSKHTNTNGDVTTISRPDGLYDQYMFYGFGSAANGDLWKVGLPTRVSRSSGGEVEEFFWQRGPAVSSQGFIAPVYRSTECGYFARFDQGVFKPLMTGRRLTRDATAYFTSYQNFDNYGQPGLVTESGQLTRSRSLTRFYNPSRNMVRGPVATERVCVQGSCYDNVWNRDNFTGDITQEVLSGLSTLKSHDVFGNLQRITDAKGSYLEFRGYDVGRGVPTALDFSGRFVMNRGVSWEGWVQWVANGRGYTTGFGYDAIGRLTLIDPPIGASTVLDHAGDASYVRESRDVFSIITYLDGFGRPTLTTNSEGVSASTSYDVFGRVAYKSYPYDASTPNVGDSFVYDALSRLFRIWHPDSTYVEHTYSSGNFRNVRNERGLWTTRSIAAFSDPGDARLANVLDADGNRTIYSYNAQGSLTFVDAPAALANGDRSFGYDTRNFLTSETNAETGPIGYGRDAVGLMATRTDARGTTNFGHDALHRVRSVDYPGGSEDDVTFDYDNNNNLTFMSSANGGTYELSYDALDRITQERWTFNGRTYYTTYDYHPLRDCLTSLTYPTGRRLTMECDSLDRQTAVPGFASQIRYHPSGQVKQVTHAALQTAITFDSRARVRTIDAPGVISLALDYDAGGNVQVYHERVAGPRKTIIYDRLDRLDTMTSPAGSFNYDYDALGNMSQKNEAGKTTIYSYAWPTGRLQSATGTGQPTNFGYDAVGNLTSRNTFTFTWDAADRLKTSSDGSVYLYNGKGQRVKKVSSAGETILYHYDVAGNLIAETRENGLKLREYIYAAGKRIAMHGKPE